MAKKATGGAVYRVIDVIGISKVSWEHAAKTARKTAGTSSRNLRFAEIISNCMWLRA